MPFALIVEDGSNVADANSFATLQQIRDYNGARGVVLPADDGDAVALASQAMDYLLTYDTRLAGKRTYGLMQSLSWPRTGIKAFGMSMPVGFIPREVIQAQCYLVGIATTIDLAGNKDSASIIKDTIGPLSTEFSADKGATVGPILPIVSSLLRPFLRSGSGMLVSQRV